MRKSSLVTLLCLVLSTLLPVTVHAQSTGVPDKDPDQAHLDPDDLRAVQVFALGESAELEVSLKAALKAKGDSYVPRTEHINQDGSPRYTNRLITEDSPYLVQHAHNPVNWYPWGKEAFARSVEENKPIFMSIGYATCHWCHVMERESFENEQIAEFLNEHFVSVKVDREQRPDVDATYMLAVQMVAGRGGWPMSSFLSPEAKPFYGGTYFPPDTFLDLLKRVAQVWSTQKYDLLLEADKLAERVAEQSQLRGEATEIGSEVIRQAVDLLVGTHDELQGGFSAAPKFPQEPSHFLLLEQARLNRDRKLLDTSSFTLTKMSSGGIHDQIAGGFHRYSVDNAWLVPHFEKMLYNQAALARLYFQAYTLSADTVHLRTSRRILDYVQREMTSPEGGFYSATDADSEGEEGVFFVWSLEELDQALGESGSKTAQLMWEATEHGNFEGSNILYLDGSVDEVAMELSMQPGELLKQMDDLSDRLLKERQKREHPILDDKLITAWNGMMITAFAEIALGANDDSYRKTAIDAANAVWKLNRREDGKLWRAHFAGSSSIEAAQADYAFLAEAMVSLYDLTNDNLWLDRAIALVDSMDQLFLDTTDGTYFMGSSIVGGAALPVRPKELFDNATASGNAVALRVMTQLWHRTGEERYHEQATRLLAAFHSPLTTYASGFGYLLKSASELIHGETGKVRYAGRGKVRIKSEAINGNKVKTTLDIAPGWHINSSKPIQDYLIPTVIKNRAGSPLKNTVYPEPIFQTLGFDRSELSLYEGRAVIVSDLPVSDAESLPGGVEVSLEVQACDDKTCLAPESISFFISTASQTQ